MKSSKNGYDIRSNQALLDKYERYFKTAQGGMFTKKAIDKLLGIIRTSGRDQTSNDFWYDRRNDVRTALVEMTLFLDVASDKNINQVFTDESFRPLLYSLFWGKDWLLFDSEPDTEKAKIAQHMIEAGFHYLTEWKLNLMTKSHQRTIEDAMDLSRFLLADFPNSETYKSDYLNEERES